MSKFSCSSSRCLLLDKLPYTPLFFAVLIEGLLVNVFHDKAFPLLPFMLLPFTLDSQKVQGSGTSGNQINFCALSLFSYINARNHNDCVIGLWALPKHAWPKADNSARMPSEELC